MNRVVFDSGQVTRVTPGPGQQWKSYQDQEQVKIAIDLDHFFWYAAFKRTTNQVLRLHTDSQWWACEFFLFLPFMLCYNKFW